MEQMMNVGAYVKKSVAILAVCYAGQVAAVANNAIVTGNQSDTYYRIGDDLKQHVMPELRNLTSKGAVDNIKALSKTAGVSFAIVQSDVYQTYVNLAKSDPDPTVRQWAEDLLHSLRVIVPLYNEEIYFIVRNDSPMQELQDIEGKRLAIGPEGSGTNLTAKNIYYKLFGKAPIIVKPFIEDGVLGADEGTKFSRSALWHLAHPEAGPEERKADVVVLIGGQPLPLLQRLGKDYKLLATNIKNDATEALLKDYSIGFADQKNYPFLPKHMPVMMVQSYLVTAQFRDKQRNDFVKKLAGSLCQNFEKLQEHGHDKWRSLVWSPLNPKLPSLLSGWSYSSVTKPVLESCLSKNKPAISATLAVAPELPCSMEDRAIGFCH
jgi:TRAP-type uncharacterized transport system substrate-binding protein